MRVEETTYQMLWDCKYCGTKKLLGLTHRFCAGCGAPQDANARYFPPENEMVAVQNHVFVGADVQCAGCQNWNSRAAKCCTNCGAPIGGREATLKQEGMPPSPHAQAGWAQPQHAGMPMQPPQPAKKKSMLLPILLGAGALLFFGAIGLFCTAMFWTKSGAVEVAGHTWERKIEIERYGKYRDSAWCDSLPAGAREVGRHKEQRSTNTVQDGEECTTKKKDNGDGTFKQVKECKPKYKDVPVYSDRCDYEAEAWKVARSVDAHGASLAEKPTWPKTNLAQTGTCIGCEREGKRSETYTVVFKNHEDKTDLKCDFPEQKWQSFALGAKYDAKIRVMTGGLDCDSLVKK
jgi:hypothetical protein